MHLDWEYLLSAALWSNVGFIGGWITCRATTHARRNQ